MIVVEAPTVAVRLVAMPTTTLTTVVHDAGTNVPSGASNLTLRQRRKVDGASRSEQDRADAET